MSTEATVFVVDDDPSIVAAITGLVDLIDLKSVSYLSARAFLAAYESTGPACLVLDIRMPGMSGLELQRHLIAKGIEIPIIVITGHGDIRMAVEAMKAGALEFLEKPFRMQELCDSVQRAVQLDSERWQLRQKRENAEERVARLTSAEREVMYCVVAGKTNKMIAAELGLSIRAIEDRRARMMKKLQVANRVELLDLAVSAADSLHVARPETIDSEAG